MSEKNKIISFDKDMDSVQKDLLSVSTTTDIMRNNVEEVRDTLDQLRSEIESMGVYIPKSDYLCSTNLTNEISGLNSTIKDLSKELSGNIDISIIDVLVASTAGIIATIIDIVFVGTPEVVKIYKGGENFDGSIFTAALRNVGNGNDKFSEMLKWLSQKCKVPYDVSVKKDVVNPNNHRLRNAGHDPLFGALFAMADILLGTATIIDNNGMVRILVDDKDYPMTEKILSLVYYLGHLLSDVCTTRGLPVPGFALTQFFTNGDGKSIAKIAEEMYRDGYDLRHLASMSTSVVVKNFIIEIYLRFFKTEVIKPIATIAEKEINHNKYLAEKYSLILISDAVSCSGNVLKFFIPPTMGNMSALNLPEWISLIKNTINTLCYQLRNKKVEQTISNRETISRNWSLLIED